MIVVSEWSKVYQTKISSTVYTITSECAEDVDLEDDFLSALVRLIKRDIAGLESTKK